MGSFLIFLVFGFAISVNGIGVSFLGFKASAGIGSDGQLHSYAGTPWGAQAGAGAEGQINGETEGSLYAGATAGGGVSAGAGLAGGSYGGSRYGGSYAGASVGEKTVEVEKTIEADVTGSLNSHIVAAPLSASLTKKVEVIKKPVEVKVDVAIEKHHPIPVPPPEHKPITTVIEKTIIPNYEKKIIKVPSYEEKIVRVPTVVEKEVWVPAPPTVIEKEVPVAPPPPPPTFVKTVETVPVFYKTKIRKHPHFLFRKHFSFGGGGGYASGYENTGSGAGGASYSATVTKTVNPQFYNDVFNIPISTLGAVNKLLTGISSGVSGSVGVSKNVNVGVSKTFSAGGAAAVSSSY